MEQNYILAKWLNNELSESELETLKKDSDYALLEKIKVHSGNLKTPEFNSEVVLTRILQAKKETKVIWLTKNWLAKIAALFVIGITLYFTFSTLNQKSYKSELQEIAFALPDNSEVILNANSEIGFSKWNWENNRKLDLSGEAYFKVAKGNKFDVNTALGTVTVLGTQFNVKSIENNFEVSCFEGKVSVTTQNQNFILTKGMVIVFQNNEIIETKTSITKPTWQNSLSEYTLNSENLQNIVALLEKKYAINIVCSDINTTQLFSGKLPADNLEIALQIIASTYHLQINKIDNSNYELVMSK